MQQLRKSLSFGFITGDKSEQCEEIITTYQSINFNTETEELDESTRTESVTIHHRSRSIMTRDLWEGDGSETKINLQISGYNKKLVTLSQDQIDIDNGATMESYLLAKTDEYISKINT